MNNEGLDFEIRRKIFHLYGVIFPITYVFISKFNMCIGLLIIAAFALYLDISRYYTPKIKVFVERFFGKFMRFDEKSDKFSLSGASFMALGLLTSSIIFPKGLAIASWFVLIVSDCLAAIVGMRFGTPLANGKSYAGLITFFASAILVSIMSYFLVKFETSLYIIIISSLMSSVAEFFSKETGIDDNFSIPLTYGFSTLILGVV